MSESETRMIDSENKVEEAEKKVDVESPTQKEVADENTHGSEDNFDESDTGLSLDTTQVSQNGEKLHQDTPRPPVEKVDPPSEPVVSAEKGHDEFKGSSSGFKDEWLDQLRTGKYLSFEDLKELCTLIKDILIDESNVRNVKAPVTICGDVHGQFEDVMELFKQGGELPDTSYIFMGDFVDRGYFSLETFSLLMASKAKWPDRVTLLRGNHETRQITQVYGFYDECMQKYNDAAAWRICVQVFDLLNTAAVVDGKIFCVHGGLSPAITEVDQIRTIIRNIEVPAEGPLCDLLWSDPEEIESYQPSPRGGGCLFGRSVTHEFLWLNELDLMARAHQLIQDGYAYMFENKLVTVWSAPNYCYRCGNVASIMQVDANLNHTFKIFNAVPDELRMPAPKQQQTRYFL